MKSLLLTALMFVLLCMLAMPLQAQELTAQEILQKTDEVSSAPQDTHSLATMVLIDKNGDQKERKTEMYERQGGDYRLVRFLSPADQKGISFLSLPDDKMYLYLPAFRKVRTIASHVKNENFAGTDFSYDDMSGASYSDEFDPTLVETTAEFYVLELTPKAGVEKDYSLLKSWVRKDIFFTVKTEYYDKGNNLWKVMERRNIEQKGSYWIAMEIEMQDLKKAHSTKSITESIEVDTGLSDDIFTQRNLTR